MRFEKGGRGMESFELSTTKDCSLYCRMPQQWIRTSLVVEVNFKVQIILSVEIKEYLLD